MILCSCNVLSDGKIKAAILGPDCPRTASAVYKCLGCKPNCGRCFVSVKAMIRDFVESQGLAEAAAPQDTFEASTLRKSNPDVCFNRFD
jgi:bacterioferritin-associated ferredoxin